MNTAIEIQTYEPADKHGPAYLVGSMECDCEDAACCDRCEGGFIKLDLRGQEAEAVYHDWLRECAKHEWRESTRYAIDQCYEHARKAVAFARVYDLDGNARGRAACVARAHELRGTVRRLRAALKGASL